MILETNENTAIKPTAPTPTLQSVDEVASAPKPKKSHGFLGVPLSAMAVEGLGLLTATGAGLVVVWNTVRINFYKNVDKYKVFDDIKKERDNSYTALYKEYEGKENPKELIQKLNATEKEYTFAVRQRFKGYGINQFTDRWKTLKYHQKNEVYLAFGAVGAIFLGMVAGMAATRRVEEHQDELEQKLDALHTKLDRHNQNTIGR